MFDWNKVVDEFLEFYYTKSIMFVVELIALVIAIIYGRKSKMGRVFIFYIAFDFSLLIIDGILPGFSGISKKDLDIFLNYTNTIIAAVELFVYYYFFYNTLQGKKIQLGILVMASLYGLVIFIYLLNGFSFFTARFNYISFLLGAIEFIFLLPFCLLYFRQLLSSPSKINLFNRPSFWIVCGIFFFSFISAPFYLVVDYFRQNTLAAITRQLMALLYYIPFSINFIFLIKAFLCKKPLTT